MTAPSSASGGRSEAGFDYIVVGSGAGGGPLAARLASRATRAGDRGRARRLEPEPTNAREVSLVPAFHGRSTEHATLSWEFFVKHYDHPPGPDPKRPGPTPPRNGIFYPRSAALGGCTVHNAMITIAGPDADWDTSPTSSTTTRGAARRCAPTSSGWSATSTAAGRRRRPTSWPGRARDLVKWLFGCDPDHTRGRHGFAGWLHTSVTDVGLGISDSS